MTTTTTTTTSKNQRQKNVEACAATKKNEESALKKAFFSIYSYVILYSLYGVLSLAYHVCFESSLSTLEKRYRFSSSTSGYIMITDNIACILTNIFIGFYGKTAHKPRWMSLGCVVTGLSITLTALPFFIFGPAQQETSHFDNSTLSRSGHQMCLAEVEIEDCSQQAIASTVTAVAVACFGVSNFFRGFGYSIYLTYGTPYLDDNVSKTKMPMFFGFVFAAKVFGAPLGFLLSSEALKYYENPFAAPQGLTPEDPRWVGAWWVGFLVFGSLLALCGIPLAFFPREFKKVSESEQSDSAEELQLVVGYGENGGELEPNEKGRTSLSKVQVEAGAAKEKQELSLKELPRELFAIITNPLIFFQMMGTMFKGIGILGYFVFQTKYLEAQFRQSASKASLVSGTTGFAGKIVGVVLGGILISICRPGPRSLTTLIFLVELVAVYTLYYGATITGPHYVYPGTLVKLNSQLELRNHCNEKCFCDLMKYQPVCDQRFMEAYFSPCHAGCSSYSTHSTGHTSFTNCTCVESTTELIKCPPDTDNLFKYATIIAIGWIISGASRPGTMVTFFRSINPEQKSLAVAVGSFWHSLLVSIPYPIIYGKIFDYSCLVWSRDCNRRGNCWLYDTDKLRHFFHGASILLILLGSVFDLVMIFLSPRLGNLYDEPETGKTTFRQRLMFWRSPAKNQKRESKPEIKVVESSKSS